mmetsp:Transcript_23606/g.59336  ORF Transcript_23606/g.59336 Transcript_23606/m.59336 type:complete len:266 (-) Transcript_23606:109-906(-)
MQRGGRGVGAGGQLVDLRQQRFELVDDVGEEGGHLVKDARGSQPRHDLGDGLRAGQTGPVDLAILQEELLDVLLQVGGLQLLIQSHVVHKQLVRNLAPQLDHPVHDVHPAGEVFRLVRERPLLCLQVRHLPLQTVHPLLGAGAPLAGKLHARLGLAQHLRVQGVGVAAVQLLHRVVRQRLHQHVLLRLRALLDLPHHLLLQLLERGHALLLGRVAGQVAGERVHLHQSTLVLLNGLRRRRNLITAAAAKLVRRVEAVHDAGQAAA